MGSSKISEAAFLEMVNDFNRRFHRAPARTTIRVDFHALALYDAEDEQGRAPLLGTCTPTQVDNNFVSVRSYCLIWSAGDNTRCNSISCRFVRIA